MAEKQTLYDRTIQRLKNSKIVVLVLLGFPVVLGLAEMLGALSSIKRVISPPKARFQATAFVQRYDFMMGNIESPTPLSTASGSVLEISRSLAKDISAAVESASSVLQSTLRIDGKKLRSDQKLRAAVLIFSGSPMAQVARIPKEIGQADELDLASLFDDANYVDRLDNSVDMDLVPPNGPFDRESLKIFRNAAGFSFAQASLVTSQSIQLTPHNPKVLLEKFESNESLVGTAADIQAELQTELARNATFALSSMTDAKFQEAKQEVQHLEPGSAKSALANEDNADYIITGNVVARQ